MAEAVHPVPDGFNARIGPRELAELNDLVNSDPDRFWLDQARRLTWNKFPTQAGTGRSTKTISTSPGTPTVSSTCRSIASTGISRSTATASL